MATAMTTTMTETDQLAARDSELQSLAGDIARETVQLFKLFADETRVRILFLLRQRSEMNVQTICELLGQTQPAVSHHLALLRANRLIEMRREGKHNNYRLLKDRFSDVVRLFCHIAPEGVGEAFHD